MKKFLIQLGVTLAVAATTAGGFAVVGGAAAGTASPQTKQYCC
jgi:hypothetical protein